MSTKFFQKKIMQSEDVNALNRSIVYYVGATPTEITNGALVTLVAPITNVFGGNDLSTYKAVYPAADTDRVYITDISEVPYATVGSVTYRVGVELTALKAEAGVAVRARKPKLDDTYLIGDGNFASAPTVTEFAVPTASALTYTPSASISTTKHCVKIEEAVTISVGMSKTVSAYAVRVVNEM